MRTKLDIKALQAVFLDHVAHRNGSEKVKLLWKGYLAALMIEGYLSPDDYHDLDDSLGEVGNEELREIFVGYPGQYE